MDRENTQSFIQSRTIVFLLTALVAKLLNLAAAHWGLPLVPADVQAEQAAVTVAHRRVQDRVARLQASLGLRAGDVDVARSLRNARRRSPMTRAVVSVTMQ